MSEPHATSTPADSAPSAGRDAAAPPRASLSPAPGGFTPPTPDQLAEYLERFPFHPPSPWAARGPLLLLGILLAASLVIDSPVAVVLPWLALAGLLAYSFVRNQRTGDLERRVTSAHEQAVLRRHREALRRAWRLIPEVTGQPLLRSRTIGLMGQCLAELTAHDAAIVAFDAMLHDIPDQHPAALHLKLQRAIEALAADRLADADETLRRLRGTVGDYAGTPLAALHRFAELVQEVRTMHVAEAVERADTLVEALRPLGVEAGYGYGLMAWCCRRLAEPDEAGAALWWDRATRLLPEHALAFRFRELGELADPGTRPAPPEPIAAAVDAASSDEPSPPARSPEDPA